MKHPPLPAIAVSLCEELQAPAPLVEHLILVHSAAVRICDGVQRAWPGLHFDKDTVLIGAATHDLGKTLHPAELSRPGSRHVDDGPALLRRHGLPPELTRFARTHERWDECAALEDLLVALADRVWKGARNEPLESTIVSIIERQLNVKRWQIFMTLDSILSSIARKGRGRLLP